MGLRWNGSVLGVQKTPTQTLGVGLWSLQAQGIYAQSDNWSDPATTPLDIASVQLWLDASDASTLYDATTGGSLVTAGNTVARWEDKSGNANHVTQSTANNRPTRLAADLNGLDGLDFDGTNDSLATATAVGNAPLTVFVVAKPDTTANVGRFAHIFGSTYAYQLSASTTFNTRNSQVETGTNSLAWGSVSANTAYVFSAVFRTTGTNGYINNVIGDLGPGSAMGDAGTTTTIGARSDLVGTTYFNGKIYEIAAFTTAFTDTQRKTMALYFNRKWGIT
jgi:hypothetical protein